MLSQCDASFSYNSYSSSFSTLRPTRAQLSPQTTRVWIHMSAGAQQYGHCFIWAAHEAHAQMCPQGTAACVFGSAMQMMHVVSPPSVDSGTSARRPVMLPASASVSGAGTFGGGGGS